MRAGMTGTAGTMSVAMAWLRSALAVFAVAGFTLAGGAALTSCGDDDDDDSADDDDDSADDDDDSADDDDDAADDDDDAAGGEPDTACLIGGETQCVERYNSVAEEQIASYESTCTGADGGTVLERCGTDGLVAKCSGSTDGELKVVYYYYQAALDVGATYEGLESACKASGSTFEKIGE